MEISKNYKGYQIWYTTIGGTTRVGHMGMSIKSFPGLGQHKGEEKAKEYIDEIICSYVN